MPLDDQTKAAFAAVAELAKQLITLGTGVLTLEVALTGGFFKSGAPRLWQLEWSWIFLLLSVICGIWVLMALAGSLAKGAPPIAVDIY